jgi:hypothetical protein
MRFALALALLLLCPRARAESAASNSQIGNSSASVQIRVTVTILSYVWMQLVPEQDTDRAEVRFRSNVSGAGVFTLEGTQHAWLSTADDCTDPEASLMISFTHQIQSLFVCGLVEGESPILDFTGL